MNMSGQEHTVSTGDGFLSKIRNSPYRQLLSAVCALVVIVVVGLLIAVVVTVFDDFDANADVLYLPAFYHDLVSGVPIRHWRVPAVVGFFPDMPLMFSILWITAEDILFSYVIYGVAIMLLLGAATLYLIGGLVRQRWWNLFFVYAILYLWLIILLVGHDGTYFLLFVLMPSCHSGIIIAGTLFLAFTIRLFHSPMSQVLAALWVLTAAVGIASDSFFLVQYFVPVLICMYIFRRSAAFPEGPTLVKTILFSISSVAIVIGIRAAARKIFSLGGDFVGTLDIQITQILPLFVDKYKELEPLIKGNLPTVFFAISGFLLATVVMMWYLWVKYKTRPMGGPSPIMGLRYRFYFCMLFFLISGVVSLVFPILTDYTRQYSESIIRYFQPLYVYPVIIIPLCLSWLLENYKNRGVRSVIIAVVFLGCVLSATIKGAGMLPKKLCATPNLVKFLDNLHHATGLRNGLGSYWLAKPSHLLSKGGVHVDAVWFPWGIFPHISNLQWYLVPGQDGVKRLRKYEFIVPYDRCSANMLIARFGVPAMVYEAPSLNISPSPGIYEGPTPRAMVYNRKSDVVFRNYLYIPAIFMTGTELPSKIQYPKNLQRYKMEGTSSNSKDCSIISPGGQLKVVFDPPAEGDILEVCADSEDEYKVEVQYTDGRSETLKVPFMRGAGLGRRILCLNNSEGQSRVHTIIISPVSGDGNYSVGHVYVYKDNW